MPQRESLPPCCHALGPGCKWSKKPNFATELTKFSISAKVDGVQRLASDLSAARAALRLENASVHAVFQSVDDISTNTQKLVQYLSLVKGFTEAADGRRSADPKALQSIVPVAGATVSDALRQPLVESSRDADEAAANDCNGCLNFCQWQDTLTGQTVYTRSARQEYAHVLLAEGILMMTDARDKVDAILSERLTELDETQLKLAYQLLLHASGVLEACLESMDITPRSVGAEFTDLGVNVEVQTETQSSTQAVPDNDMMAKWREEQRQARQETQPKTVADAKEIERMPTAKLATEDLAMFKRVPDLADGRFPQLLAWIALAEAQELVVLRGVTREVVDFSLMAKLSMDISTRYKECQTLASGLMPNSTSITVQRIRYFCAYKEPYYQAISMYFQGAACMLREDARNCVQAVANLQKAAVLFEGVVPIKKGYETKMAADKVRKTRVSLLNGVFLRSQQIISRDLDIVTHRNDSVYCEPIPEPDIACKALSLVKSATFPSVSTSDLWRDGEIANCLKPTAVASPVEHADKNQQQQNCRSRDGCCGSCIVS